LARFHAVLVPLLAFVAGGVSGITIWVTAVLLLKDLHVRRAIDELDLRSYLRRLPRRPVLGSG
jgi:hypothetical protein